MTVDITSHDGTELLGFTADPARPGYVTIISAPADGEYPDTEIGSFRVVDLIRILGGFK